MHHSTETRFGFGFGFRFGFGFGFRLGLGLGFRFRFRFGFRLGFGFGFGFGFRLGLGLGFRLGLCLDACCKTVYNSLVQSIEVFVGDPHEHGVPRPGVPTGQVFMWGNNVIPGYH